MPDYLKDSWITKLFGWVPQTVVNLSFDAANADAPAITTSAGLQKAPDGTWNWNAVDNPGSVYLRDALSTISGFAEGAEVVPLVAGIYNILRHPVQTAKVVKYTAEQSKEFLKKYLSLVKEPRQSGTFIGNRSSITKPLAEYMESLGVDSSYFTEKDLRNMMEMREQSILSNPITGRSSLISELRQGKKSIPTLDLEILDDGKSVGGMSGFFNTTDRDFMVGLVNRHSPSAKGVSESAYNSVLNYAKQNGMRGVRTGDHLISPEITYKVWEKYPTKQLISRTGEHEFNRGRDVVINKIKPKPIYDGPIYRLTEPSYFVPTKHTNVFHPDVINPEGTLRKPFWRSSDIYKSIIPLTLFGGYYNSNYTGQ